MTASAVNQRRNVLLLSLCQAAGMTLSATVFTTAALVGYFLADEKALATLPQGLFVLAVTLGTIPASMLLKRRGLKIGFATGAVIASCGAALTAFAIAQSSFALFTLGCIVAGFAQAFGLYYRFAAADISDEGFRSKAISLVLAGGVVAAIAGPQLSRLTRESLGAVPFFGTYIALIFVPLVIIVCLLALRLPHSATVDVQKDAVGKEDSGRSLRLILKEPAFLVALAGGVVGYAVMSFVMTATPLAMAGCGFAFDSTANVIQWHILAMFLPSFFTGWLVSRFGLLNMMLAGVALMFLTVGIHLAGTSDLHFTAGLISLGLGWNFLYIGSTVLVTRIYTPAERAKTQAMNEFVVFGSSAAASLSAGALQLFAGWEILNMVSLPFLAFAGLAILWLRLRPRELLNA